MNFRLVKKIQNEVDINTDLDGLFHQVLHDRHHPDDETTASSII